MDKDHLTLRHNLLGEVRVARDRVKELVPWFHGRRVEIDHRLHHLGDPARLFPDLQPARAEGPGLRETIKLTAAPGEARLVVSVLYLEGEANGKATSGPRTEVIVNGRTVDYLERRADRVARVARSLTVALPRSLLRTGENVVELRQAAGRRGPCLVAGLALELPADD
jgi:hypothetical protein